MPATKQPEKLKHIAPRAFTRMLVGRCRACFRGLPEAARRGYQPYLQYVNKLKRESEICTEIVISVPIERYIKICPVVARQVLDAIADSDTTYRNLPAAASYDEELYTSGFRDIFKAVLCQTIKSYDTSGIFSSIAQKLVIQTLDSVQNLTSLEFDSRTGTDHSALLASNIRHLPSLDKFQYFYHCTNEVIEQLGLHCSKVGFINLCYSTAVTDVSVPHLLRLRKLAYIDVSGTSISCESYRVLLKHFPVENIVSEHPHQGILGIMRTSLDLVTRYRGSVQSMATLIDICCNITSLTLCEFNGDLSSLTQLQNLDSLEIEGGNYITYNLHGVLSGTGSKLVNLELQRVVNVDISHIITLCIELSNLTLNECIMVPSEHGPVFDPLLPHFTHVTTIRLTESDTQEMLFPELKYYGNLINFSCMGNQIINDNLVMDAIRAGALSNLQEFLVVEMGNGVLTVLTPILIITRCENLRKIGHLVSWHQLTADDRLYVRNYVRGRNYDISVE